MSIFDGPLMDSMPDIMSNPSMLYQPDTTMLNQFINMMGQVPTRTDPSIGRKLLGFVAGLGTLQPLGIASGQPIGLRANPGEQMQVQNQVSNAPYYRSLNDFETKLKPIAQAAELENQRNTQNRLFANETAQRNIQSRNETRQENRDQVTAKQGQEKIDISDARAKTAQQRADAYTFDKQHPNLIKTALPGDTLKFYDPKTGQMVKDTGVPSGTLDDTDKINLNIRGRLSEIGAEGINQQNNIASQGANQLANTAAQGANQQNLANTNENNRQADIAARGTQQRQTNQAKPANNTNKPLQPTQEAAATYLRAQQALATHPEWAKYITFDKNKTVKVQMPAISHPGDWATSNTDELKTVGNYIFGQNTLPPANTNTNSPQLRKQIPGSNKFAVSTDNGKTWKAE